MINRMMRAARLEVPFYEEIEADISGTNQALLVVVLVALASGIGAAIGASFAGASAGVLVGRLVSGVVGALVGWAVWSYVVYFVGTRLFRGTATYGELLRTLGFAESPGVLLILSFIPVLGGILSLVVFVWTLVASFIATRQALDVDNTKTFFTILLGAVALVIVVTVISLIFAAVFATGALFGAAAAG
ncbi:MAG: YIP1 family protein [Chloroflexota bacterium]|nr:YIP1 family protein [Chloroflexota bacterium]